MASPLVGEYLLGGGYNRFETRHESDGRVWSHSEALNLDLWWDDGALRFWDPVAGRWLLSQEEERAGRLEAEAHAGEERERRLAAEAHAGEERERRLAAEAHAGEERERRLAAESRLAELEAELRRLRDE